ncbi:MAG: hypothetical protein AAGF71_00890 [Pseudomonadota bacterium]
MKLANMVVAVVLSLGAPPVWAQGETPFEADRWFAGCLDLAGHDFGFQTLTLERDCLGIAISYCELRGFEDATLLACYDDLRAVLQTEADALAADLEIPDGLNRVSQIRVEQLLARNLAEPERGPCQGEVIICALDHLEAHYDRRTELALAARIIGEAQP